MTLDEARGLAYADPRREHFPTQAAYAQVTEARERLVHALGAALRPDPPMRVVAEALRRAEEYRELITTLVERPREPVELSAAEAAAWLERERPSRPRTPALSPVAQTPQGEGSEIGYVIGAALAWLIHALGGL